MNDRTSFGCQHTRFARLFQIIFIAWGCFSAAVAFEGDKKDFFVFLTTGKSTQGVEKDEIQKKQQLHIDNFGRLAKLGSLTAAGPCVDPAKSIRGIVVIHAKSPQEAGAFFEPDPYVSEGFMKAELHEYRVLAGRLHLIETVTSMEQSVIVVVGRGKKWSNVTQPSKIVFEPLSQMAKEQFANKSLGFGASFEEADKSDSPRIGVLIFRGKELQPVRAIMDSLPMVKDDIVAYEAFPQYLAKGAIGED